MGLFSSLLLLPLAPVRGVMWIAETLQTVAEDELNDPQRLRDALREAEAAHARGELSDDDLAAVEQYVLDRLVPVTGYDEVSPT
jgi:hypothetical protein